MPPAARITDPHICPMVTGVVPHVGGPILPPGVPTVLINMLPAAHVTSMATCVGPPDVIVKGSAGVFINYMPAARMGDLTAHGGVIAMGSPNVIVGEIGTPMPGFAGLSGATSGLAMAGTAAPVAPPPGSAAAGTVTVVKVSGTVAGTAGVRPANAAKARATSHLKASSSASEDLTGNPPVVLVRGCKDVKLTATTTPPNSAVTWDVKPNQNTNAAPALTPDGTNKATLKTGQTGSFAVTATAGSSKVVWNVVFVSVEVDVDSTIPVARKNYVAMLDKTGNPVPGFAASGVFQKGQDAWESTVTVNLVGGGSDGKLGIDEIKLKVLQNGITDTLAGQYAAPPAGAIAEELPKGGLPIVDSNGDPLVSPTLTNPSSISVTPATGPQRTVWTGDSPTGGFDSTHQNTHTKLLSLSGINGFKTAVVSTAKSAPTEFVAHAEIRWQAHFDGTMDAAGLFVKSTAHTVTQWKYSLISSATGGQDAGRAGYETFPPRFNEGTDVRWTP